MPTATERRAGASPPGGGPTCRSGVPDPMPPSPLPRRLLRASPLLPATLAALAAMLVAGCSGMPASWPSWPSGQAGQAAPAGKSPAPGAKAVIAPEAPPAAPPAATATVRPAEAAAAEPEGPPRKEFFFALTTGNRLIRFNAGQPGRLLSSVALSGLRPGEEILGIDFRVAPGKLYALGRTGSESRLLLVDPASGKVSQVGSNPLFTPLIGSEFGFDFNPTVDRIRVVSDTGQNLRLHPDTGEVVDADPASPGLEIDTPLAYDKTDRNAKLRPAIVAAAYTYNKKNEKITTNFAIDARAGTLVIQGSPEGDRPMVSPNTGRLRTVKPLGIGAAERVGFDIADLTGAAFISVTRPGGNRSTFHLVDLATGRTTLLGTIGGSEAVRGISFEP